jgi:RNA polymerase sigma-70 factor (ECF subfamily)
MILKKGGPGRRQRFQRELEPVLDGLYRTGLRLTRDPTRAEDLVQEAVLKAYRFFDTYKPGTNFRAWIFRVLYTVFINQTREKAPTSLPLDGAPEPAWEPTPLEEELGRPTHVQRVQAVMDAVDDRIKVAVSELPEDLRLVFLLSTVEGLKYREIADVMHCPLGTVMSRLFRSRRILQEKLAELAKESGFSAES